MCSALCGSFTICITSLLRCKRKIVDNDDDYDGNDDDDNIDDDDSNFIPPSWLRDLRCFCNVLYFCRIPCESTLLYCLKVVSYILNKFSSGNSVLK